MCLYSWDYAINHNEDENEKRSLRHDLNRPRFRHECKDSKYKKCLSMMMLISIKQQLKLEAQFMRKLSNTEAELKKGNAYKKKSVILGKMQKPLSQREWIFFSIYTFPYLT